MSVNDDIYYQKYPCILVVLLMPLFPASPFRMLLMSPLTIPKKLVHKGEGCYRVGYYLVNFVAGVIFVGSLGLLEFTMVFGLPMFWVTVPSTYCGSSGEEYVEHDGKKKQGQED